MTDAAQVRWENGKHGTYKATHSLNERIAESHRIITTFPGRFPVIAERGARQNVPILDKCKFLVYGDLTVGQFVYVLRRRMALTPETALFLFFGNTLPTTSARMSDVYASCADADGFLYVVYTGEATFGARCAPVHDSKFQVAHSVVARSACAPLHSRHVHA